MPKIITEDMIEQAAIKAFEKHEEYTSINCMTEDAEDLNDNTGRTDKRQVVLPTVVFESLCKINPDIPESTVRIIADELCRTPKSGDLMLTNFNNYQKIRNGITVEYEENGRKTSNKLKVVDFTTPENNSFIVASQMWIKGESYFRRPDLIVFINGLPIVFIELKNSNIPVKNSYDINLKNYLTFNALKVASKEASFSENNFISSSGSGNSTISFNPLPPTLQRTPVQRFLAPYCPSR